MAKQIARLLRTDVMADIDVPAIAQFLQSQGRRGDSVLAHINPKEAALLKKMGGAETVNPVTGLPEYFKISDYDYQFGADFANSPQASANQPATSYENDYINRAGSMFDLPEEPVTSSYYAPSFNLPYGATFDNSDITGANLRASNLQPIDNYRGARANLVPDYRSPELYAYSEPSYRGRDLYAYREPSGLKMDARVGLPTVQEVGGAVLAPELTVPERVSAVQLGPASMAARQAADRELARETTGPGVLDRASAATGLSKEALARLGLAGLGTIQGIYAARQAAEQGREARRETEALARPYQQRGQELIQQAQRGELTPQGQQSLQALRARLAQGAEARGGVGAAQAAAQIEAYRQNLLQNQFDYGQKISNIGDQLMLGAIRTGLEADRYASNLSNTYFTNMARIAVGMPTGTQGA